MQPQHKIASKIVVASQDYPPDPSTTGSIMAEIACRLATEHEVEVLSGSPGVLPAWQTGAGKPRVIALRNRMAGKAALVRRGLSELRFVLRIFLALLRRVRRGDVVLTVTAPFMLPYAVTAAAWLKGARSALIMHDLFPDVLVMAGLLKPRSFVTGVIASRQQPDVRRAQCSDHHRRRCGSAAAQLFRHDANKVRFVPNWATLLPAGDGPESFRKRLAGRFSLGCRVMSVSPMILRSYSRRHACSRMRERFNPCSPAGVSASSG